MRSPRKVCWNLAACVVASAAVYALVFRTPFFVALGPLRNLAATLAASLPFALAAFLARRTGGLGSRAQLSLVLGGALLLRLCLPLDLIEGTDDAYRYLWDGKVLAHGHNPYLHAPDAPELRPLADQRLLPGIYRPEMRTVYPPLAELWFFAAYAASGEHFGGLKLIFLLHELATVLLLCWALRRRGQPPLRALLYAWSPLAVIQLFAGVHLDALLLPWLLLALLVAEERPALGGAALALSALIRPITALCGPAIALRRPWREACICAAAFALTCAALVLPFAVAAGTKMVESLQVYGATWVFNGSLFVFIEALLGRRRWVRLLVYGTVCALSLLWGALPLERRSRAAGALASYFALAPTVYPWYLLSVVVLLVVDGGPLLVALPALLTCSDLVFVEKRLTGRWRLPPAVQAGAYLGVYALAIHHVLRRRRARRSKKSAG